MIKKILILTGLIIILVSLNWFNKLYAQDLSQLSAEQKQLLLDYQSQNQSGEDPYRYKSNDVFTQEKSQQIPTSGNTVETKENKTENELISFEELEPFGMELFNTNNPVETPMGLASASDYVLGPGDNIIIYLWGRVEKEFNLTIDREGKVFIPKVGELVCWGLTLDQFKRKSANQFSKVYSEFDLTVSLGKIRSIQVYVTGEVNNPGAYTVSSLTSLFDALYLAGGPNKRGSMRTIKLMREGSEVAQVDLYKLLLEGDNTNDVKLHNGDVIFIPVAGIQVAIRGEIRRSAIYELLGNESPTDILKLAGNPSPQAHLERVMLERISPEKEWEVKDLDLSHNGSADNQMTLINGDRLTVYSIFQAKQNIVAVFGMVKHEGYYERNDSLYLSDIVNQAQLQDYDVYYQRADLFRLYQDGRKEIIPIDLEDITRGDCKNDLLLRNRDSLHVYSIDEIEIDKHVFIEGEVKKPGRYPLYSNMTVNDLIFQAGSFKEGALRHKGEIARLDENSDVKIFQLNLDSDADINFLLADNDHLYIRQIPQWELDKTISIEGEVLFPGKYTLSYKKETLWQLINRAGGFTYNAFPQGLIFKRRSIKDNLARMNVEEIIDKSTALKKDTLGNIQKEEVIHFQPDKMDRIIIDMDKLVSTNGTQGDIVLQTGDEIFIPKVPSGISVIGAVSSNGTLKFKEGESVKYYLKKAGNYSRYADKKETRLIKANGEVYTNGRLKNQLVELGDVIIVPTKVEKEKNWGSAITATVTTITGILTSVYVISKL